MNEMKRISVRVPSWVKEKMDKMCDINWSQKIRDELIQYLRKDDVPIELRNIIRDYKNNGKRDVLMALFLYAVIYENTGQPLKTNFSIMFKDKAKNIENKLQEAFEKLGVKDRYDKVFQERNFCDVLLDLLLEEGVIDDLEEEIIRSFENMENKEQISKALYYLGIYLDNKTDATYTCFDGRQMEILFSHLFEKPEEIIRKLNEAGIIYYDYYDSVAYSHKNYNIPVYSYKLILDVYKNPYKYSLYNYSNLKDRIEDILSEKRNRDFLKWLKKDYDKNFYDDTTVQAFAKRFDHEYGKNAFNNTLRELVEKGFLICHYWPDRRKAGKRSSMPARLYYNLSPLGKRYLSEIVFETLVADAENKGELENLIEIYEKHLS